MRFFLLALSILLIASSPALAAKAHKAAAAPKAREHCGWYESAIPSSAILHDGEGDWVISEPGGYVADGEWAPEFAPEQWLTIASTSYGCACITATVDNANMQMLSVSKAVAKPINTCRDNKSLKWQEPTAPQDN
jgi:hypothetical protein